MGGRLLKSELALLQEKPRGEEPNATDENVLCDSQRHTHQYAKLVGSHLPIDGSVAYMCVQCEAGRAELTHADQDI